MIKKGWNAERKSGWRVGMAMLTAALVLGPSLTMAQKDPVEVTAFTEVWQRADYPVAKGVAKRSWLWGPEARENVAEPLAESPNGMRQVRYYDKSRMEMNDPNGDPKSPWFVTNGLLVVEMISGHMQTGVSTFEPRQPAAVTVAGDVKTSGASNTAPTYATLGKVATIDPSQHRSQPRIGQDVRESLSADGTVGNITPTSVGRLPKLQLFESVTGHNIPDVFWSFMNQRGMVYENGQYREGQLFNWLYAMGYPLTEPYWITIEIAGKKLPVMMQAFQRRILTYNPANAQEWRVEMGNVGMQYHDWRYGTNSPQPQPTVNPGPKEDGTPLKFRRVVEGSRQFSAINDPLYTALGSPQEWQALWNRHSMQANPANLPPAVDFKSEFVVAAFWGAKSNGCYSLSINGVRALDKTITVSVSRVEQTGSVCASVLTQPHDFIAVTRVGLSPSASPAKYDVVFIEGDKVISTADVTLP